MEGAPTDVIIDVIGYLDPETWPTGSGYANAAPSASGGKNYIFPATSIVPTRSLTCRVTADLSWYTEIANASGNVSFKTARRNLTTSATDEDSTWFWQYLAAGTAAADANNEGSKTAIWSLAAGNECRFGCAIYASGDYVDDGAYCVVTWDCR